MEITGMRRVNYGKLRAFFNLKLLQYDIIVRDCKLIEGNDGQLFAATPSRQYEKDGETKYAPVVEATSQERRQAITELARQAYHKDEPDEQPDIPF